MFDPGRDQNSPKSWENAILYSKKLHVWPGSRPKITKIVRKHNTLFKKTPCLTRVAWEILSKKNDYLQNSSHVLIFYCRAIQNAPCLTQFRTKFHQTHPKNKRPLSDKLSDVWPGSRVKFFTQSTTLYNNSLQSTRLYCHSISKRAMFEPARGRYSSKPYQKQRLSSKGFKFDPGRVRFFLQNAPFVVKCTKYCCPIGETL